MYPGPRKYFLTFNHNSSTVCVINDSGTWSVTKYYVQLLIHTSFFNYVNYAYKEKSN